MNTLKLLSLVLLILIVSTMAATSVQAQVVKGPPLDRIIYTVRTTQERGVLDVSEGKLDVFMFAVSPKVLQQVPYNKENVKLIPTRTAYYNLVFNPYSDDDEAGKWGVATDIDDGTKHFNPFALKKVRFAFQFINRKYIIENILAGGGVPKYGPIGPAHGAYDKLKSVYEELGLTPEGDESKLLRMIDEALTEAAQHLEKLGYKLYKKEDPNAPAGYWWYFQAPGQDEEPVTVVFIIRPEDERKDIGNYVADLIEKAGIKVERKYIARAASKVYGTDPATLWWHIYTAGWVTTAEALWPEGYLAFFGAAWAGWLPSWIGWEYNKERAEAKGDEIQLIIEDETYNLYMGKYTGDLFWEKAKEILKLIVEQSIRVFLVETEEYFVVNRRVHDIAAGRATGLSTLWAFRTAWTEDGTLVVAQFSTQGALFMSAWNPVGGLQDIYTEYIARYVYDLGDWPHPSTGERVPIRTVWKILERGDITIPGTALIYNHTAHKWQTLDEAGIPPEERKAVVKVQVHYLFSKFHHGRPMSLFDILADIAWFWDWAYKDGEDDKWYHDQIAEDYQPYFEDMFFALEIVNETDIIVYGRYAHPIADDVTGATYNWWTAYPIEIMMTMEHAVLYGGPVSGKSYGWYEGEADRWVDLLDPDHLKDLRAILESYIKTEEYIPPYLKATYELAKKYPVIGNLDLSDAAEKALAFLNKYGHLFISNGPFYIARYVPTELYIELNAFRDPSYPFTPEYWTSRLIISKLYVEDVRYPRQILAGHDIDLIIRLGEEVTFPETEAGRKPAAFAYVEVSLLTPEGKEVGTWPAEKVEPGVWEVVIPGEATKDLSTGTYTIVVKAGRVAGTVEITDSRSILIVGVAIPTTPTPTPTTPVTTPTTPATSPTTPVTTPAVTVPTITAPTATATSPTVTVTTVAPTAPGIGPEVIVGIAVVIIVVGIAAAFLMRKK